MGIRHLLVVADDYGIGPEVSRSINELMQRGSVSATVLLVNSPYAEAAIREWRRTGCAGEMGWHPNLNLDPPVLPAGRTATLLGPDGNFWPLGKLLPRLLTRRVRYREIVDELDAQLRQFHDLVGEPPRLINGHKHMHVFPLISAAMTEVLERWKLRPYIRRIAEPLWCLAAIPGARLKRCFLSTLGRINGRHYDRSGMPGNDWLAGITDPKWVHDPQFFSRWLGRVPGQIVELAVHPGHRDTTLIGRDCTDADGQLERRMAEHRLLAQPEFVAACTRAGLKISSVAALNSINGVRGRVHAAA